jgi:hypothetical protein
MLVHDLSVVPQIPNIVVSKLQFLIHQIITECQMRPDYVSMEDENVPRISPTQVVNSSCNNAACTGCSSCLHEASTAFSAHGFSDMPLSEMHSNSFDPYWSLVNGNTSNEGIGFSTEMNETSGGQFGWDENSNQHYFGN